MLVSVIIPNYNHEIFLAQRIESVLQQTYRNFELIILDDASTDNSGEIIEKYRGHDEVTHIVYNAKNSGSTFRQWQKGIALAAGKYIWLAESDDIAEPGFLEACMEKMETDPSLVLVYTNSKIVDERGEVLHKDLSFWYEDISAERWANDFINEGRAEIREALSLKNTIPNASAVVFKKNFFTEALGFRFCGDWIFWIKLLEGGNLAFISEPLNQFRTHVNTTRYSENSVEKSRRFLKERAIILNYLERKNLIERRSFRLKRAQIIYDWKHLFTITDIIKKDFYIPFKSAAVFGEFIFFKAANGCKRVASLFSKTF